MLHRQIKFSRALIFILAVVALCAGCAAPPASRLATLDHEIDALRAFAHDADVVRELHAAAALCREASVEVAAQRVRFWAARSYRRVGRLLDDAESHLATARTASTRARYRAEREARAGMAAAVLELARMEALLDAFPVDRDTVEDRTVMRRDVVALRTALVRAREVATEGDPQAAAAVAAGVLHEARLVAAFATRAAALASPEVARARQDVSAPGSPAVSRRRVATGQGSSAIERTSALPASSSMRVPPR